MEETYRRLTQKLELQLDDDKCHNNEFCQYWIGIAGGPGSGKSTVAHGVADRLNALQPESAIVIGMDGWHFTQQVLRHKYGDEGMKRRGAPWTIDVNAIVRDLSLAHQEGEASLPEYCREISDPIMGGTILARHHKIVFVEGLYVLMKNDQEWGKLYNLWDETWFIAAPNREEQIDRLVSRSLKTWGSKKIELFGEGEPGARKRAEYNDVPNMDVVDPCRDFADEVIVTTDN
jgi:pantothenate kinase